MRKYKNFGLGLGLLFLILGVSLYLRAMGPMGSTVYAAPLPANPPGSPGTGSGGQTGLEGYALVYNEGSAINDFNNTLKSGFDGLNAANLSRDGVKLYAQNGIYGNTPQQLSYNEGISRAASDNNNLGAGDTFHYYFESNYTCQGWKVRSYIDVPLKSIPQNSYSSTVKYLAITDAIGKTYGNPNAFGGSQFLTTQDLDLKIGFPTDCRLSNPAVGDWLRIPSFNTKWNLAGATINGGDQTDSGGDDTSACVANSSTTLEWLLCPLITAISKGADAMNSAVESQLNFKTNDFLPNDGGVHKAWTIIKDLVSSVLIILLLIMVISQALGNGIFEAYTVKKVLPRLVIAVIGMQLSWDLCIFIINIANHLGEGLKQIMAAPFGGEGNLDLPSLLNHLSGPWALITSITLTAAVVSTIFLGTVFLPGALLVILTVILSVFIALATVLFRNIIIIACVMFSPLALLLWVAPGQGMQRYWKLWSENFTKVLLLFPLMIAIIYGGRIFAWIAGDLSFPGFLDLIMVLVGFFGPYFLLPKAFQWGGSWMKSGANAIQSNWATKKAREVGKKELGDFQRRRMKLYGKSNLDPGAEDYAKAKRVRRGPLKGLPYGWEGKLGKTAFINLRSGRVMPTRRALGSVIQQQDEENSKEKELRRIIDERKRQKTFGKTGDIAAGKQVAIDSLLDGLRMARDASNDREKAEGNRIAEAALRDLIKSNSFFELDKVKIEDPEDGKEKFIWQTKLWANTIANDNELYGTVSGKRPDWQPHRLPTGLPSYRGQWDAGEQQKFRENKIKQGLSGAELDAAMVAEGKRRERLARHGGLGDDDLQYASAIGDVIDETSPQTLANQSPLIFDRISRIAEQGKLRAQEAREALTRAEQLKNTGRTAEAKALEDQGKELMEQAKILLKPSDSLREAFTNMAKSGGTQLISNITAGAETKKYVNELLGHNAAANKAVLNESLPSDLDEIVESVHSGGVSGAAAAQQPAAGVGAQAPAAGGAAPAAGGGGAVPGGGGQQGAPQPHAPGGGAAAPTGGAAPASGFNFENMTEAVARGVERAERRKQGTAERTVTERFVPLEQGGELRIPHLPGEVISPGGVVAPPERRTRPPEG